MGDNVESVQEDGPSEPAAQLEVADDNVDVGTGSRDVNDQNVSDESYYSEEDSEDFEDDRIREIHRLLQQKRMEVAKLQASFDAEFGAPSSSTAVVAGVSDANASQQNSTVQEHAAIGESKGSSSADEERGDVTIAAAVAEFDNHEEEVEKENDEADSGDKAELLYDEVMQCYFDPQTNTYYELMA